MTDGLTEANQALKNHPVQPIGAMPAEVAQLQLRTAINRTNPGLLDAVDAATLDAIMRLLVSREERRGKQVQNPVGFCIRAIGNEPGGHRSTYCPGHHRTLHRPRNPTSCRFCPAALSPCCLLPGTHPRVHRPLPPVPQRSHRRADHHQPRDPADVEAGKALRDQLRARRQAKKEVA